MVVPVSIEHDIVEVEDSSIEKEKVLKRYRSEWLDKSLVGGIFRS